MDKKIQSISCAVVTMSDKGAAGEREDTSGASLQALLKGEGYSLKDYRIVTDDEDVIVEALLELVDVKLIDLIITTGGTGVSPRDVTPEAMTRIIEKEVPGMAEAMRAYSISKTPHAVISRAKCGIRKSSLIINLPGSKKAALENLSVILPALPHAVEKIKGGKGDCATL